MTPNKYSSGQPGRHRRKESREGKVAAFLSRLSAGVIARLIADYIRDLTHWLTS